MHRIICYTTIILHISIVIYKHFDSYLYNLLKYMLITDKSKIELIDALRITYFSFKIFIDVLDNCKIIFSLSLSFDLKRGEGILCTTSL